MSESDNRENDYFRMIEAHENLEYFFGLNQNFSYFFGLIFIFKSKLS